MTTPDPARPIDALLIDDHLAFRQVLAMYFRSQPGFHTVLEAGSSAEARDVLARRPTKPDQPVLVIVLDLHLGPEDGVEVIPHLQRAAPDAIIVTLSAVEEAAHLGRVVEAGASALLSKQSDVDDIVLACRRAAEGTVQIDSALAIQLMRAASRERSDREQVARVRKLLTPRELEILRKVAEGQTDREIAQELHIAYDTVRTHVSNALGKLGFNNRIAAVLYCIRYGLIPLG
ncbi:MAG TPA: response regulator transcription factor [Thermomicrobiales bacterium]|jgi:NarL family two-component system response regulator LiaR|nr:response regulator transcription factor [Thermomicrobiales bacterium]